MQGGDNKRSSKKIKKIKKVLDRTTTWSYNKSVDRKATKTRERGTNYDEYSEHGGAVRHEECGQSHGLRFRHHGR